MSHGCGDAGVCESDAGQCVQCVIDSDCKDAANPRCDDTSARCVPCLPANDNCGANLYCALSAGDFQCSAGCKTNSDCANADGGTGGGDDGGAADGGAEPSRSLCDPQSHQCSQCLADTDCPLGQLCQAGSCGAGCNPNHGCPAAQTCCGAVCSDLQHDPGHCGACGTPCIGGFNCCGGACSDPAGDVNNCRACGGACTVANGSPLCGQAGCAVGFCNPGFGDCNGSYADGCETSTSDNVNNCGACNFVCTVPHAIAKCTGGACQVGTCVAPWVALQRQGERRLRGEL